jgi:hypothetical protein
MYTIISIGEVDYKYTWSMNDISGGLHVNGNILILLYHYLDKDYEKEYMKIHPNSDLGPIRSLLTLYQKFYPMDIDQPFRYQVKDWVLQRNVRSGVISIFCYSLNIPRSGLIVQKEDLLYGVPKDILNDFLHIKHLV